MRERMKLEVESPRSDQSSHYIGFDEEEVGICLHEEISKKLESVESDHSSVESLSLVLRSRDWNCFKLTTEPH